MKEDLLLLLLKKTIKGLLGSPVVKTPPSNAGGTGLSPCQGPKILHAACSAAKNLKIKNNELRIYNTANKHMFT